MSYSKAMVYAVVDRDIFSSYRHRMLIIVEINGAVGEFLDILGDTMKDLCILTKVSDGSLDSRSFIVICDTTVGKSFSVYLDIIVHSFYQNDVSKGNHYVFVSHFKGYGFLRTLRCLVANIFCLPNRLLESRIENWLMKEVNRIHIETIKSIIGISSGEYQAYIIRQIFIAITNPVMRIHP